jgi:Ca2+:H+ antiporter
MSIKPSVPIWTIAAQVVAWVLYFANSFLNGDIFNFFLAVTLVAAVLAAVHHAEVIAYRVGEPYGSLILAVAVTVIEVSLIVSLILNGGPETTTLARDTVFAQS